MRDLGDNALVDNTERTRLGVQDALWLEMDRPHNLMEIGRAHV
jgi:hypothetical protein